MKKIKTLGRTVHTAHTVSKKVRVAAGDYRVTYFKRRGRLAVLPLNLKKGGSK